MGPDWLQRLGDQLQRRQGEIRALQWCLVGIYYLLLLIPAILPPPVDRANLLGNLAGWAEILFWGLWWPLVLLSVMLFGQFWCGLLCPDGALTEAVSRHGRGGKIPVWVRRPWWPALAFATISLYEHVSNAYQSPRAILISLGGVSLLALLSGYLWGRGKRVWCRYLCPVSSIFSLLARCAVLHFRIDRQAWDNAPKPLPRAVDCPPLLDVRRLRSNEKCSMCGRCSGHRAAVALSARPPGSEIIRIRDEEIRTADGWIICGILIGLTYSLSGSQQMSPIFWMGMTGWEASTAKGLALALAVGGLLYWAGRGVSGLSTHLAYGLIPLAGMGMVLGALTYSFKLAADVGINTSSDYLWAQAILLGVGAIWSSLLLLHILRRRESDRLISYLGSYGALSLLLMAYL